MIRYLIVSTVILGLGLVSYHVALKKEKSFVTNRFFLLFTLIVSLVAPFIKLSIAHYPIAELESIMLLDESVMVAPVGLEISEGLSNSDYTSSGFSWPFFISLVYGVGVVMMLVRFVHGLMKIRRAFIQGQHQNGAHHLVINTRLDQPFTFWKYIFLNDPDQMQDEHLMAHEQGHVHQYHTLDVLIVELVMVWYWFNPLVHLYKKAISLNHEFQADQQALNQHSNIKDYLYKVVGVSQNHRPQLTLASNFSYVSLKSRLKMISKNKSSKMVRILKWSTVCLVMLLTVCAFSIKPVSTFANPEKEFVVVIDAGHGGEDTGAVNERELYEKDVVLDVAKLLQQEFDGSNIKVVMTRSDDTYLTLEERIDMTKQADLNVSLHVETIVDSEKEMRLFIYDKNTPFTEQSERVAKVMALQFDDVDCGSVGYSDYKVLHEAKCPSVMAILGVFSNPKMDKELFSKSGQEEIANKLSKAIRIAAL